MLNWQKKVCIQTSRLERMVAAVVLKSALVHFNAVKQCILFLLIYFENFVVSLILSIT